MGTKKLSNYQAKRDFSKTPEPSGKDPRKNKQKSYNVHEDTPEEHIFVVQKHEASHLHYDFRIQIGSVLVSWAVPKGPPLKIGERRLAIQTEDHPLAYANFSGIIPTGEYGAGKVQIWDKGTFSSIKQEGGKLVPLAESLKQGLIEIYLNGKKLKGAYALVRTKFRAKEAWLFIKMVPH